jgi:hypothetical protein
MTIFKVDKTTVLNQGQAQQPYEDIFYPYIKGANSIEIFEPYIRKEYQVNNLRKFIELFRYSPQPVKIQMVTTTASGSYSEFTADVQVRILQQLAEWANSINVSFTFRFDNFIHVRKITTDTGWIIKSDRGLDIYQVNGRCKATEIDYIKSEQDPIIASVNPTGENSIVINNITARDAESRRLRILNHNKFLFPAERNGRTVYDIIIVFNGIKYDAKYTIGSNDEINRSGIIKLFQNLFNVIGIQEGTVLKMTRSQDSIFTIEKL